MKKNGLIELARARTQSNAEVVTSGWQLPSWGREAACRSQDPGTYFPDNGRPSKSMTDGCVECPVRAECLAFALEGPWIPYGPWGGLTQTEVQAMWFSRHPGDRSDEDTVSAYVGIV